MQRSTTPSSGFQICRTPMLNRRESSIRPCCSRIPRKRFSSGTHSVPYSRQKASVTSTKKPTDRITSQGKSRDSNASCAFTLEHPRHRRPDLTGPVQMPVRPTNRHAHDNQSHDHQRHQGKRDVLPSPLGRKPHSFGTARRTVEQRPQGEYAQQYPGHDDTADQSAAYPVRSEADGGGCDQFLKPKEIPRRLGRIRREGRVCRLLERSVGYQTKQQRDVDYQQEDQDDSARELGRRRDLILLLELG